MDKINKAIEESVSTLKIEQMEPSKDQLEIIKNAIETKKNSEEVIKSLIKLKDENNGKRI